MSCRIRCTWFFSINSNSMFTDTEEKLACTHRASCPTSAGAAGVSIDITEEGRGATLRRPNNASSLISGLLLEPAVQLFDCRTKFLALFAKLFILCPHSFDVNAGGRSHVPIQGWQRAARAARIWTPNTLHPFIIAGLKEHTQVKTANAPPTVLCSQQRSAGARVLRTDQLGLRYRGTNGVKRKKWARKCS